MTQSCQWLALTFKTHKGRDVVMSEICGRNSWRHTDMKSFDLLPGSHLKVGNSFTIRIWLKGNYIILKRLGGLQWINNLLFEVGQYVHTLNGSVMILLFLSLAILCVCVAVKEMKHLLSLFKTNSQDVGWKNWKREDKYWTEFEGRPDHLCPRAEHLALVLVDIEAVFVVLGCTFPLGMLGNVRHVVQAGVRGVLTILPRRPSPLLG